MQSNLHSDLPHSRLRTSVLEVQGKATGLRVLIALASYGQKNQPYLQQVIHEYRSMSCATTIVVLSNIPRDLGRDIEVRVGLPDRNPWSLPFAHKQLFAERMQDYDLFIYAEDDILIRERNIEAFVAASQALPEDVIPGFVHAERDDRGTLYFAPVHSHFHWDPSSVRSVGDYKLAFYTNEHSACFALTRKQLQKAIRSGGFLVDCHEGRYDMLCTASTDPYTQCGFRKMICISHLDDFTVYHLPNNKYATRPYRSQSVFRRQIEAMLELEREGRPRGLLFNPETSVLHAKWSKDYYESVHENVIAAVPIWARKVLSIGCGWGRTEQQLVRRGHRMVGVPMDSVIGACAEDQGIEVVYGDFDSARATLNKERFDCILFVNMLHLVPNPLQVLSSFSELLAQAGTVVVASPNFASLAVYLRRLARRPHYRKLGSYKRSGLHLVSRRTMEAWLRQCGLKPVASVETLPKRVEWLQGSSFGILERVLASEIVITAQKA